MNLRTMRPQQYLCNGLVQICNHVNSKIEVKKALEVGSYLGESTVIFAQNFPKIEKLIAVDPYSLIHNSDLLFDEKLVIQIYEQFLLNIKPYKQIEHLKLSSEEASKTQPDNFFDFIYIDGCHQKQSVINDINYWLPKIRKNGFISFHDYDNAGVRSAINEYFDGSSGFLSEDNSITIEVV
jgi:predicted O-methyltransferase YrrM